MSQKFQYIVDFLANTEKFQKEMGGIKGTLKAVGVAAAAYFSTDAIIEFGKAAITAYNESAQAESALLTALKGRADVQGRLIDQAAELQNKTLFEDDETIRAQSLVAAFIKEEKAIEAIIPVIQDFAAAKRMDLASAADLVTKTIAGEMNALGRYGIQVEGAAGSAARLASVQKGLNDAFGGQAQAAAKAGVGALTLMKNAYGDLLETIGGGGSSFVNENARFLTAILKFVNGSMKESLAASLTDNERFVKELKSSSDSGLNDLKKTWQQQAESYKNLWSQAAATGNKEARAHYAMQYDLSLETIQNIDKEIAARKKATGATDVEQNSVSGLSERLKTLNEIVGQTNASDTESLRLTYSKIAAIESQISSLEKLKKATAVMFEDSKNGFRSDSFSTIQQGIGNNKVSTGNKDDVFNLKPKLDVSDMQKNMPVFQKNMAAVRSELEASNQLAQSVAEAFVSGFNQIGESIVSGLGLAKDGLEGFMGGLISTATQFIATMLAKSLAAAIFNAEQMAALTGPLGVFSAPVLISNAIAGVMGAFAAIPAFANGGIAYGPTMGLMGEYPGARTNPEIIAPLSKLKEMIGSNGSPTIIVNPSLEFGYDGLRIRLEQHQQNIRKRT